MNDTSSSSLPSVRLIALRTFVEAVQCCSDPFQIGERATTILKEAFGMHVISLYQPVPTPPVLHLLARAGKAVPPQTTLSFDASFWERFLGWMETVSRQAPLVLTDVHRSHLESTVAPLLDPQTHSCLCVPLWYQETFEGLLLAEYTTAPQLTEADLVMWSSCGWYLADALSRTQWQRAIERERREHRPFAALLEQFPFGIVLAEANTGRISYVNPLATQMLGMDEPSLFGHLAHELLPTPHAERPSFFWAFALIRALSGETLHRIETIIVRSDRTQMPVACSSAPLRTAQDGIVGAMLILQDITVQKQVERHKNVFLAQAGHELRTPLTGVLGYAELLKYLVSSDKRAALDQALVEQAAGHISTEAEHMAYLIDDLLDITSLDLNQLTFQFASHDLRQLLISLVEETQMQTAAKHHLTLVLDGQTRAQAYVVQIDQKRLTQALRNLLGNAIKYSPDGGTIEIGLREEGQSSRWARLWITDQGVGVVPEDVPHLFERFYRSSKPDTSISGLGIGLYLAKQVIVRHGGHLWVESVPGQGATFFVLLPLSGVPGS
jgi:PAS domain S-box-containing protein